MKTANLHLLGLLVGLTLAACQPNPTPTPAPDFDLQVAESLTVVQGRQQSLNLALNRRNGHNEAVQVSLEAADGSALPAGISASFSPDSLSANQSQLSLSVAASVAAQDYLLRVRARTAALDKQAPLRLTVQAAPASPNPEPDPAFSLSLAAPSLTVTQGQNGTVQVNISRTNLGSGIQLSLVRQDGSALPSGISASFNPNPATGNSSALQINVATGVTPQSYALQVRGTAGGLNASVNLGLEVRAVPVSQTINLNTRRRLTGELENARFVAFQNGDAAWQSLSGSNGAYSATVTDTDGRYSLIVVCTLPPDSASEVYVQSAHLTVQEATRLELCEHPSYVDQDFAGVTGQAFGLTADDPGVSISAGRGVWNFDRPASGEAPAYDLLAYRGMQSVYAVRLPSAARSPNGRMATRGVFIRDLNLADTPYIRRDVDFAGPQAFDLAGPFTVNVTSAAPGATYGLELWFQGDISGILLGRNGSGSTNMSYRAIPDAQIRSGEFHWMIIRGGPSQWIYRSFADASNLSIPAPPAFTPTFSHNSGLPRAAWTQSNQGAYVFDYSQDVSVGDSLYNTWKVIVSKGWLRGNQTFALPNIDSLNGWNSNWTLNAAQSISVTAQAVNINSPFNRLFPDTRLLAFGKANLNYDETSAPNAILNP